MTTPVLLIEDVPIARKLATVILEAIGCRVLAASTGAEALTLAANIPVSLIWLDMHLPDLKGSDGLLIAQAIKRQPGPNQFTPIVALTANDNDDLRKRAEGADLVDFLVKPLTPALAQAVLDKWGGRDIK